MEIHEDDPRLVYVSLDELATPKAGIVRSLINDWWSVHPTRGAIFYKADKRSSPAPQCNQNEQTAKLLASKLYPFAQVQQVPVAFYKVDPRDY